jgi:hypothetical protein
MALNGTSLPVRNGSTKVPVLNRADEVDHVGQFFAPSSHIERKMLNIRSC